MYVTIRLQGIELPPDAREALLRRLHVALDRFAGRIRKVVAYVGDVNGPRGGIDKRCRLVAEVAGAGPVTVEARESSFGRLFGDAAGRLAQTVRRQVNRARRRG